MPLCRIDKNAQAVVAGNTSRVCIIPDKLNLHDR